MSAIIESLGLSSEEQTNVRLFTLLRSYVLDRKNYTTSAAILLLYWRGDPF